jgi:hypothetical protein
MNPNPYVSAFCRRVLVRVNYQQSSYSSQAHDGQIYQPDPLKRKRPRHTCTAPVIRFEALPFQKLVQIKGGFPETMTLAANTISCY